MSDECIFCKIIARQLPASIVAEDETCIVIKDIHPKASIHYLIIPKKHVQDLQSLATEEIALVSHLAAMAQRLYQENGEQKAFKLMMNNGYDAGQRVFHLHMHYLAGTMHGHV